MTSYSFRPQEKSRSPLQPHKSSQDHVRPLIWYIVRYDILSDHSYDILAKRGQLVSRISFLSLPDLDLEAFSFHFSLLEKSESDFHFIFHFLKRENQNFISLLEPSISTLAGHCQELRSGFNCGVPRFLESRLDCDEISMRASETFWRQLPFVFSCRKCWYHTHLYVVTLSQVPRPTGGSELGNLTLASIISPFPTTSFWVWPLAFVLWEAGIKVCNPWVTWPPNPSWTGYDEYSLLYSTRDFFSILVPYSEILLLGRVASNGNESSNVSKLGVDYKPVMFSNII